MVSKKQTVFFEAYQACGLKDGEQTHVNISKLINNIKTIPIGDRSEDYFGSPVRMDMIHDVSYDKNKYSKVGENKKILYFHLTKMRDDGIATTQEKQEDLKYFNMDENEYLAEDVGCFFDEELCMLFIQRNFYSLSVRGLCFYLKTLHKKISKNKDDYDESTYKEISLDFKPVADRTIMRQILSSDNIRGITLGFASNKKSKMPNILANFLGVFGDGFSALNESDLKIELMAKQGNPGMSTNETLELMGNVEDHIELFTTATVNSKQGDNPIEKYDLINGKLRTSHKFSSVQDNHGKARKMHLQPSSVEEIMKEIYFGTGETIMTPFRDLIVNNLQ